MLSLPQYILYNSTTVIYKMSSSTVALYLYDYGVILTQPDRPFNSNMLQLQWLVYMCIKKKLGFPGSFSSAVSTL